MLPDRHTAGHEKRKKRWYFYFEENYFNKTKKKKIGIWKRWDTGRGPVALIPTGDFNFQKNLSIRVHVVSSSAPLLSSPPPQTQQINIHRAHSRHTRNPNRIRFLNKSSERDWSSRQLIFAVAGAIFKEKSVSISFLCPGAPLEMNHHRRQNAAN